nr:hypothetical protein [Tanacetum cinerariifolium]
MAKTINGEAQLHAKVDGKNIIITKLSVRRDLRLADEEDEAVHKELGDRLVRAATTASSLEAKEDSGGGPKCQESMGDTTAQTRFESVSKHSNDSLLARRNTLQSDEDRHKLDELMDLCTNLKNMVFDLEQTKTTQKKEIASRHDEIASLKRRVKKLEKRNKPRTHKLKKLYKERRIDVIDADKDITLVSVQDDANKEMFDVNVLDGEEVFVARQNINVVEEVVDAAQVSTAMTTVTITTEEITLAQALETLKTSKPKDKGKGIMIKEHVKPKKKDQIRIDEEPALKLQAKFDEKERLAREKAKKEQEANIALIEEWDDIQAKIHVDHQLAERIQAQEQEELFDAKKATLF